jgi:SAM-dependent MidA family methyltransferase
LTLNQLAKTIAAEIQDRGVIPFARFMELALFCPVSGYYEKEADTIGRRGDFYTSVSVGPLFGELLAFRFAEWLANLGLASAECHRSGAACHSRGQRDRTRDRGIGTVKVVEAGAHRGDLARDILRWFLCCRPEQFHGLEYWIVEPSLRRRTWQERSLHEFQGKVHWVPTLSGLSEPSPGSSHSGKIRGIIFSNELLDSFPVHRFGWDGLLQKWFEWGVTFDKHRFFWTRLPAEKPGLLQTNDLLEAALGLSERAGGAPLQQQYSSLFKVLPDGFTVDVCPAASEWWREASKMLACGRLLTIDYGLLIDELFLPERSNGTLRGYHHHSLSADPLANPGEQDLTAHVNFTTLRAVGENAGLETLTYATQAEFLTRIVEEVFEGDGSFGLWTSERSRQFQTLTHPEHLGRAFRVLVQRREQ